MPRRGCDNLSDGLGPAADDAVDVPCPIIDGFALQVHHGPARADQQGMASGDIPGVEAVGQANGSIHLARCGQSKAIGRARQRPDAAAGQFLVIVRGVVGGLCIEGEDRRPLRVRRRRARRVSNAVARQRRALGPGDQVAVVIGGHGGEDHAQYRPEIAQERNRDRRTAQSAQEIGRAVLRINHPDVAGIDAVAGGFFAVPAAGMKPLQTRLQECFDFVIDGRLGATAARATLTVELGPDQGAGVARGVDHPRKQAGGRGALQYLFHRVVL